MSIVKKYKNFEIHFIPNYPTNKDATSYLFEVIKDGLKFLSILRYLSKSRLYDINLIRDKGVKDIEALIDKLESEFEKFITFNN